ncbi:hypothetical protein [Lamprocystis purpurea]|uniref:hypothetical protein n=1 Tax=Lamprocystis purpurea TaxID=61598 RepID=UPI001FDECBB6|nr:hypothetical protein [Lamprocystis purpurea]
MAKPRHGQALRLGEVFAGARGQVGRVGEARQTRPHVGEAGGDLRHGLHLAALQVVGVIQDAQFTALLTGLRLSGQGLGLFGFGRDQFGQGRVAAGREGRWSAARTGDLRVIRPLRGARRVHQRLGRGDGGAGLPDLAGQVQTGPLGHRMLSME